MLSNIFSFISYHEMLETVATIVLIMEYSKTMYAQKFTCQLKIVSRLIPKYKPESL